jgi:hydrogenase maturation protease
MTTHARKAHEVMGGTVVIGLGNVVMSDDGLGVHAVRRLGERYELGDDIELVEGGTAGLLLLPYLADARRVIIVDAIEIGAAPGTPVRFEGEEWSSAFAVTMTPHDVGLADLLSTAQLTGMWPDRLTLHGAQPDSTAIGTELSAPVAAAIDSLVDQVVGELTDWGVPLAPAGEGLACA